MISTASPQVNFFLVITFFSAKSFRFLRKA